jgi:hypothetical protein
LLDRPSVLLEHVPQAMITQEMRSQLWLDYVNALGTFIFRVDWIFYYLD